MAALRHVARKLVGERAQVLKYRRFSSGAAGAPSSQAASRRERVVEEKKDELFHLLKEMDLHGELEGTRGQDNRALLRQLGYFRVPPVEERNRANWSFLLGSTVLNAAAALCYVR